MNKTFLILIIFIFSNISQAKDIKSAYLAGGCFWCMEESFEKVEGVLDVISGYTGGKKNDANYKAVVKGGTGHFETIRVIYDNEKIKFKDLLKIYWKNIDPFDSLGQFCDKGYSYKAAIFYQSKQEKELIIKSINLLEKNFQRKIVTYVKKFEQFYDAEDYHQNYYKENFLNYLLYKKGCKREEILSDIWD